MKKMDEMEMNISLRSIKWAWFYTVLFLFGWIIYDLIVHDTYNSPASFLLVSQNLIYLAINQYSNWKMGKDEK